MSKQRVLNILILACALVLIGMAIAGGSEAFGWFSHGVAVAVAIYILVRNK